MEIINDFCGSKIQSGSSVIALGTFDGLHLGHCDVVKTARTYADRHNCTLLVFTFSNHPLSEIKPDVVPAKLISNKEKEALFAKLGVDILVNIPFTHHFSKLSPTEFLEKLKIFSFKCLVVGENYSYGFHGVGNTETLIKSGKEDGFDVIVRKLIEINGTVVSSSKIRELIKNGDMTLANEMLGRAYEMSGTVVSGANRGSCLGFPTANIEFSDADDLIVPAKGVYAAKVLISGVEYLGMANIGYSPTFGDIEKKRLEVNVFDFIDDIYGKKIIVRLMHYIRKECKFNSAAELCGQIQKDKNAIYAYFQEKEKKL
ncbi:MAG: bifunctional riboflavin kinase/FAD synthetase [Acidaminococcaceae bacterium]